jgi:dihydroflavonol-4-reductase
MATTLVLGATGHIGAHIVRALLAEGHQVRAAYRRETYLSVLEGLPVARVRVNVQTGEGLSEALQGCDWVFHAAGYYPSFHARRQRAVALGVDGTRRVCDALRQARIARVVFTSSAATLAPTQRTGWHGLYGAVKWAMEQEVLRAAQQGLAVVITNPSICIGEYDAHPFSGQLVLLYAKYRLPIYLARNLSIIYTGDVGHAHVRAAERGRIGQRYVLHAHTLPMKAFAACVAQAAGIKPPRWRLPGWLSPVRQAEPLDSTPAMTELGMRQTPADEAIRRAVAWFRVHRYM